MTIALILGYLFAISLVVLLVYMVREAYECFGTIAGLVGAGLAVPVIVVLLIAPYAWVAAALSPDLVTLKKNEWVCAGGHNVTRLVLVGKVWVPQTQFVCDSYARQRDTD